MSTQTIGLTTPTGPMKTTICTPAGTGPWPAVIVCIDAGGRRDAIVEIGERLAKSGFLAAVPDLFHAFGDPLEILPEAERNGPMAILKVFRDDALKAKFFARFYGPATDYKNIEENLGAVLDHLEKNDDVTAKIGTTGYCMGGNISFRAATVFGDRITATATFHGGFLVTDAPDSPHKRAAKIASRVYVAGAIEDASFTDAAKTQLEEALTGAKVKHEIETYDARHGFAVRDNPTYDANAAERHYATLERVFGETLRA